MPDDSAILMPPDAACHADGCRRSLPSLFDVTCHDDAITLMSPIFLIKRGTRRQQAQHGAQAAA